MSTTIITQFSQNNQNIVNNSDEALNPATVQDDASIEICNAITHGNGKDKYTDYEVKVKPNSSLIRKMNLDATQSVRRRYSDFIWLNNELNNLRLYLPAKLPGKQFKLSIIPALNKKNFEEEFIRHRCKHLEKYLNKMASNPLIQTNHSFHRFLQEEKLNKSV